MNVINALEGLQQSLELIGQSKERSTQVSEMLSEAVKEGLDFFSDKCLQRRQVALYPCEILAAQHFLTQFGFHLKRIQSTYDKIGAKKTYGVFPNWQ